MKHLLLLLGLTLWINTGIGQDTIVVQAFDYNSATRDSLITFPTGDHNQYEKILMHYNMRCKDGLVVQVLRVMGGNGKLKIDFMRHHSV